LINRFLTSHLKKINWILVGISHPGNLGASLRALKNLGGNAPILVDPERNGIINCEETKIRAAHAANLINEIKECTIVDATQESHVVIGFTSRQRAIQPPQIDFDKMIEVLVDLIIKNDKFKISFMFGGEKNGLKNSDLMKCTSVCSLDVAESYTSLNLSHAIQVVAYMFRRQLKIKYYELQKKIKANKETNIKNLSHNLNPCTQKRLLNIENKILSIADELNFRTSERQGKIESKIRKILVSDEMSEEDALLLESFFALIQKNLIS
jgi:tRNA/rRNA methyltransferase